ncbi:hypothetical protein GVN18_41845 [Pseudomonas sp. ODNR1LW]|nr:hypothetical protein [Pseudomonas sp. ODNR1LW]
MPAPVAPLELERDGAELAPKALDSATLAALGQVLARQPGDVAGIRLFDLEGLPGFLAANDPVGSIAAQNLGGMAPPIGCANWLHRATII